MLSDFLTEPVFTKGVSVSQLPAAMFDPSSDQGRVGLTGGRCRALVSTDALSVFSPT